MPLRSKVEAPAQVNAMSQRYALSDVQWNRIKDLLLGQAGRSVHQ